MLQNNYSNPLTDDRLFGWHSCLFPNGRSGMEAINVGQYRVDPMEVSSSSAERRCTTELLRPSPFQMRCGSSLTGSIPNPPEGLHQVRCRPFLVRQHPPVRRWQRTIARAISDMALSQADDMAMRFYSISRQKQREAEYDDIIEKCQRSDCDITLWIDWYLGCMLRAIEGAGEMLQS